MAELNKDEKIVEARTSFDVGKVIIAIAFLLLVLGLLKYIGVSPF